MSNLLNFLPYVPRTPSDEEAAVFKAGSIPDELDIFFRDESYFLPEGKTFDDLTDEELAHLRNQYRFSALRPGVYQGITGRNGKHGSMLNLR